MNLKFILINLLNIQVLSFMNFLSKNIDEISFGELIKKIELKQVDKIVLGNQGKDIISIDKVNQQELIVQVEKVKQLSHHVYNSHHTHIEPFVLPNIIAKSIESNVNIGFYNSDTFDIGILLEKYFIPFVVLSIGWNVISLLINLNDFSLINNSGQKTNTNSNFNNLFTNPLEKKNVPNKNKFNISISSWVGSPEAFEECYEVISYIKNASNYEKMGAELPKGILLEGPPGVGKTLLAKAIASETNSSFISVSGSEFVELFVGMGAKRVRDLFSEARQKTPCIIFIDEIDTIGKKRSNSNSFSSGFSGNDEREQTLNQLLSELDGFNNNDGILILASTNRKDILDPALIRPGRFDRIINVPLPDKQSRKSILEIYLSKKNIEENINIDFLAELTAGFSGAQIKNLVNEAAINAARVSRVIITQNDIKNALEKIVIGIIKKVDNRTHESKTRVALHEIGHGFLAWYFKEYFELQKISIQSTYNGVGGFTIFNEYPDITESGLYTKDILKKRIIIALGGKAAEEVFYGDSFVSLGASQDLKQANSIAQKMIGNYGMGDDLKIFYNENIDNNNPFLGRSLGTGNKYSEMIKEIMDKDSLNLVNECYKEAYNLIDKNKKNIGVISNILIESTTLDSAFVNNFFKE